MLGYTGKTLIVDLTDRSFEIRELDPEIARCFIGGAALGGRYLMDIMPAHTPVFDPASVIGFISGPTNATKAFLGARITIVHKSPVTGGWNDSSVGGSFGSRMRQGGYDAIFVKGKSEKPVYLFIDDGRVNFCDASQLWGKTVSECDAQLREEVGDKNVGVLLIGPGGEHRSYMAAVICDTHRAAGRGGPGSIMGSKNLKALVARGSTVIEVADEDALVEINKRCVAHGMPGGIDAGIVPDFNRYGTSGEFGSFVMQADAPIKNWLGAPEDMTAMEAFHLTGMYMDPLYRTGPVGCNSCFIRCGANYANVKYKDFYAKHATRPEHASLGALGSMTLNSSAEACIICNWLCNEYGYDTISFGGTIGWAMECYDKGILTLEDTDGIELKWGSPDAQLAIAKKICDYEGIGIPLNLASRGAARALGKGLECCVTAGGIELPYHGSRFNPALARTFQYDPSPGRHLKGGRGVFFDHQPAAIKYSYENTGGDDVAGLLEWELVNATGICGFGNSLLYPWAAKDFACAITGNNYTEDDWRLFALRSFTLRHAFNLREGFRRRDFRIDGRAVGKPPIDRGPLAGVTVDNEKLGDNFYSSLGWDLETAMPPVEFIKKCQGLDFLIKDLYPEEQTA